MDAETPPPARKRPEAARARTLDEVWPVHRAGAWPNDLSLRRQDMYDERSERAW